MKSMTIVSVLVIAAIVFGPVGATSASLIIYGTTAGTNLSNGLPVNAQATFLTGTNTVSITLSDLQVNIQDITQTISGISFAFDNLKTGTKITSSGGQERAVHTNKSFTDGASVPTGWQVILDGQSMQLMLPDPVSAHTIIGPASGLKYAGANSSITGNPSSSPFLVGPVTFVVNVPGITASTQVDWAILHFGTCAEYVQMFQGIPVPEPATITLMASALCCAAVVGWRRRRLQLVRSEASLKD